MQLVSTAMISLKNLLSRGPEAVPASMTVDRPDDGLDAIAKAMTGMCVECQDQPADSFCEQCGDDYCAVCFKALHRRGLRQKHVTKPILPLASAAAAGPSAAAAAISGDSKEAGSAGTDGFSRDDVVSPMQTEVSVDERQVIPAKMGEINSPEWFLERSKYIPLRLTLDERKYLRLVEAAMNVSEYTDRVDIISFRDKARRIFEQIKDICSILSGLMIAHDYAHGQKLVQDREFKDNESFFQSLFEILRRHKIRNPEKCRSSYGKLLYMLMDSQMPEIKDMLEFSCVKPVVTIYDILREGDALAVLQDHRLPQATVDIVADGKPRHQIDREIRAKERAVDEICAHHASHRLSSEQIRMCIGSINDNHNYLKMNRDPCIKMIEYLTTYFKPDSFEPGSSLAIVGGRSGARLTHSHSMQYFYVLQSLTLWKEVAHEMFKLWYLAEQDCLDPENPYRLRDTGQGLNRVQSAPRVHKLIHHILHKVQQQVTNWVGSSVVHLGDHNVPNAFFFIDKYNQVARILNPVVLTCKALDRLADKPDVRKYILDTFGSIEQCRKDILRDFFCHAFDGSGADNFFDAGSCIDGRLTSAWHWCSQVDKQRYYPIFLLAGFSSFDGEFAG